MDSKILFEAAREGKVEVLERLLQQNPLILADITLISLSESVLHVATKSGQLNFVHELMKVAPDTAGEMDKDGFRPLDIAVIMGNLAIFKTILSFNNDLVRLTGKDNNTALHYAAAKGRGKIVNELLSTCPDCLGDITAHGETALHLSVKHYHFNVLADLVKWLEKLSHESIINIQDEDGNTVLHLAVATKQHMCLNLLLDENFSIRGIIDLNVPNGKGLTALDISDVVIQDSYDAKVRERLQHAGAVRAQGSTTVTGEHTKQLETNSQPIQINHDQSEPASKNWFEYFRFKMDRDSPSETRTAMLVVAALIVTITFQCVADPPSGLFDASHILNSTNQPSVGQPLGVSAFTADFLFLFFNTLGFSASGFIISYLTIGFPLYRELWISLFCMSFTYGAATGITTRGKQLESKVRDGAYTVQMVALFLPYLVRWLPLLGENTWNYCRKRAVSNTQLPIANSDNNNNNNNS